MMAELSGPLFDGSANAIVEQFAEGAVIAVATRGLAEVHTNLNASIKYPTPYYETQINISQVRNGLSVNDRGVIYGPWLEGTSKRNGRSRFKGYASFRRARQYLERNVDRIIQAEFSAMIRRLG